MTGKGTQAKKNLRSGKLVEEATSTANQDISVVQENLENQERDAEAHSVSCDEERRTPLEDIRTRKETGTSIGDELFKKFKLMIFQYQMNVSRSTTDTIRAAMNTIRKEVAQLGGRISEMEKEKCWERSPGTAWAKSSMLPEEQGVEEVGDAELRTECQEE
ncbi:unnamed protein product [Ceratitis capitata]|uniref:(Mediterranean fruit fly) hypothetical protein n=1 Tax=Ceratitis capitata TaxID=7213 RepID=A0A811UF10_CERCA|nr:unnamed protein product [Ceratitis capitata]